MVPSIDDSFTEEMLSEICSHTTFLQFQGVPSCTVRVIYFKTAGMAPYRDGHVTQINSFYGIDTILFDILLFTHVNVDLEEVGTSVGV